MNLSIAVPSGLPIRDDVTQHQPLVHLESLLSVNVYGTSMNLSVAVISSCLPIRDDVTQHQPLAHGLEKSSLCKCIWHIDESVNYSHILMSPFSDVLLLKTL